MNKNWKKTRLFQLSTLTIVILALTIPTTSIIASNTDGLQNPTSETKILSILLNDVDGEDYSIKKEISDETYNELNVSTSNLLALTKDSVDDNSPDGKNITVVEWDNIQEALTKIIDKIYEVIGPTFPYWIVIAFLVSLINLFHGPLYLIRQPILSFGLGITWLPFYDYETFLGKMLRPILMRHLVGFSITGVLNPFRLGFVYWRFGPQRVRTFLFRGLIINFAELGIERLIGPQILIGYGVFTGFTH